MISVSILKKQDNDARQRSGPANRDGNGIIFKFGVYFLLIFMLLATGLGCSHQMRVMNLGDYPVVKSVGSPLDVALAPFSGTSDEVKYFNAVIDGLRRHPRVRIVRTDWSAQQTEEGFSPSGVVELKVAPQYSGSGVNFPIAFPGFILFTCAWNGFHYKADIATEVIVSTMAAEEASALAVDESPVAAVDAPAVEAAGSDLEAIESPEAVNENEIVQAEASENSLPADDKGTPPASGEINTQFEMRHCSFSRGFWSGTGWWFPGYGATNIIVGAVYTGYDKKATGPFHKQVDDHYGDFIAEKIVCQLKAQ